MRRFILAWKQRWEQRLDAPVVNYADDYVICCRGTGRPAYAAMAQIRQRLKLTVNEAKTSLRGLPAESVDFLGYTLGWCYSKRPRRRYIGSQPSKKSLARARRTIHELTSPRWVKLPVESRIDALNRLLMGWAHDFRLGPVWPAYLALDRHTRSRLRRWLRRKHKVAGRGVARFPDRYLHLTLGLIRLTDWMRNLPWAHA